MVAWWPSGLEHQFQIQVEAHSKTQVQIPLGVKICCPIMPFIILEFKDYLTDSTV